MLHSDEMTKIKCTSQAKEQDLLHFRGTRGLFMDPPRGIHQGHHLQVWKPWLPRSNIKKKVCTKWAFIHGPQMTPETHLAYGTLYPNSQPPHQDECNTKLLKSGHL